MYSASVFYTCLILAVYAVYRLKKLSLTAALVGGVLAGLLFIAFSFIGVALLAAFFVMGTLATSHGRKFKVEFSGESENAGMRDVFQVLANGGIAGLTALLLMLFPEQETLWIVMMAGAFSAASADTLSSELGNIYGSRFVNILSLKTDERGKDGVISLEGTLAGLVGSLIIALILAAFTDDYNCLPGIILAGLLGNLADSFLGAAFERRGLMGNNSVNLLNTVTGALSAGILHQLF